MFADVGAARAVFGWQRKLRTLLWTFDAFKDRESYQHLFYSLLLINNMLCGTRVSSYHSMWLYEKCTSTSSGAAREIVRHKAGKVGYRKPHARIAHIKQLCISFCYPDSEVHERSFPRVLNSSVPTSDAHKRAKMHPDRHFYTASASLQLTTKISFFLLEQPCCELQRH